MKRITLCLMMLMPLPACSSLGSKPQAAAIPLLALEGVSCVSGQGDPDRFAVATAQGLAIQYRAIIRREMGFDRLGNVTGLVTDRIALQPTGFILTLQKLSPGNAGPVIRNGRFDLSTSTPNPYGEYVCSFVHSAGNDTYAFDLRYMPDSDPALMSDICRAMQNAVTHLSTATDSERKALHRALFSATAPFHAMIDKPLAREIDPKTDAPTPPEKIEL